MSLVGTPAHQAITHFTDKVVETVHQTQASFGEVMFLDTDSGDHALTTAPAIEERFVITSVADADAYDNFRDETTKTYRRNHIRTFQRRDSGPFPLQAWVIPSGPTLSDADGENPVFGHYEDGNFGYYVLGKYDDTLVTTILPQGMLEAQPTEGDYTREFAFALMDAGAYLPGDRSFGVTMASVLDRYQNLTTLDCVRRLCRTDPGATYRPLEVWLNYGTSEAVLLAVAEGATWGDGSPGTGVTADPNHPLCRLPLVNGDAPDRDNPTDHFLIRVTRTGRDFTVEASHGVAGTYDPTLTLQLSAREHPQLARFPKNTYCGVFATAEPATVWLNGPCPEIYDRLTNTKRIHRGFDVNAPYPIQYEVANDFEQRFKPGRLYFDPITAKVFSCTEGLILEPVFTKATGPDPGATPPGPTTLIAGDFNAGFFGEVPVSELIDGIELASLIGLTNGIAQHSDEPWLKFSHQGKILYIAKKPYRHGISWTQIHARSAVFGTDPSVIEIGGVTYKCRLLTGGNADPAQRAGGEWNDLIYPIHVNDPEERDWATYTDADLLTHNSHGSGAYSWCQETDASGSTARVIRGHSGVLSIIYHTASASASPYGWRPVLELVT